MNKQKTFRILWVCLLLLLHQAVWAQSELKKANNHFKSQEFALAIAAYQQVLAGKEPTQAIAQNLAQAYYRINNTPEAETWLAKVLTFPNHDPQYIYLYAEVLRSNGKYPEAKAQYQAYAAQKPDAAKNIKVRLQAIDSVQSWLEKPVLFTLKPEISLNSVNADFSPTFYDKGLLFTSDRPAKTASSTTEIAGLTGRPYLKLFYTEKAADNSWAGPMPLETVVNTATHNGPATATSANNIIYFTRTIRLKTQKSQANTDPTSWADEDQQKQLNRLAIYSAEKRGGKWINLRAFAYNKVSAYSVGHPALSPDGRYLYFVSDMPGGRGQTDIYFCERRAGNTWSKPINAGPAINTSSRESFPVVHADGTLYFASDGHAGMGGLDIFSAKGSKAAWKAVTNLKPPFNSPKDDFGILFDKNAVSGYLSSNRDSEDGTDDIYRFEPLKEVAKGKKLVLAITSKQIVLGKVASILPEVQVQLVNKAAPGDTLVSTSGASGVVYSVAELNQDYIIAGSKTGFVSQLVALSTSSILADTLKLELTLKPIEEKAAAFRNIYFSLNKAEIPASVYPELDELVQVLKNNPKLKIEVSGHSDKQGEMEANTKLSQRRADAVVNYLVSKGVARNRLVAMGYGTQRLVYPCPPKVTCSEKEHQQNRRIEFVIK